MKKKRIAQSAFPQKGVATAFLLCAVCWIIAGTGLAFFHADELIKASHPAAAGLTFGDRVTYQRAIEEVCWRHRIWPSDNANPKPSLDDVMSAQEIEKKVEDYLCNSQALEDHWKRPITAEQLQGEMDRMAQHTKQPEVLRELFKAIGNDAFVIAECLARPLLAERLITDLYVHDQRSHRELKWRTRSSRSSTEYQILNGIGAVGGSYTLPKISDGAECSDDTWMATTTTNAPSNRPGHTA